MTTACVRQVLPNVKDFKTFWKKQGPFRYALTSNEYPPVLLEPEEWILGQDKQAVLKELMQFSGFKVLKDSIFSSAYYIDKNNIIVISEFELELIAFPLVWKEMLETWQRI